MDFYLGYSIHRQQVTLNQESQRQEWKQPSKQMIPNTPTDRHVTSKYLLAQLNFSFSNQSWPRPSTLTRFTTFYKVEDDSGYFPRHGTENALEKSQQYSCERLGLAY